MVICVLYQYAEDNTENFSKKFAAITKQLYMEDYVHLLPTIKSKNASNEEVLDWPNSKKLSWSFEGIPCEDLKRVKRFH